MACGTESGGNQVIKTIIKLMIVTAVLCISFSVAAEEVPVAPAAAEEVPVAPAAEPPKPLSDVEKLKEQVKRLEDKLTKMSEENDIRRRLETTEEEKSSSDDAILTAAGRDYTLMKPGTLGFEYSMRYAGDSYDSIHDSDDGTSVKHNAYHTVTNSFFIEFPVKENLTFNSSFPFVYKFNSQTSSTAKDVSDFGDVSFGCQFQPIKSGGDLPSIIVSGSLICPTGRSPYKIDSTKEISTGNGVYSVGVGCNMSKSVDPLVVFGGVNIDHGIETTHLNYKSGSQGEAGIYLAGVDPGETYSLSMGIGYSLSYKATLTLSYQYTYQSKTSYDWEGPKTSDFKSEGSISSVFSVGTGWNISPKKSVNVRLGIGLTNNDPDFSIQVRVPLSYEL